MGFFEFNVAMSGLFTAQKGLQVTGNNISNANTKGYSRQVSIQKASTPIRGIGVGMTGTGSYVDNVSRSRDSYLDMKLWKQNASLGENNIKVTQSSLIESAFGEPSDSGFTKVFNNVFTAIDNLSKDPSSSDYKFTLKEELESFSSYYNNIASTLVDYRDDLNTDLKATVQEINNLSNRIQSLNAQIFQTEIYGSEASSFRDERDLCIDRLSEIINTEVTEEDLVVNGQPARDVNGKTMKKTVVRIAGQTLVDHYQANTLKLNIRGQEERDIDNKVINLQSTYDKLAAGSISQTKADQEIAAIESYLKKTYGNNIEISSDHSISYIKDGKTVPLLTVNGSNAVIRDNLEEKYIVDGEYGLYDISWENGLSFSMSDANMSGEIKAIIDMRDGVGTGKKDIKTNEDEKVTYNGIPYYIDQLNTFVRKFAMKVNEEYSKDKDGNIELSQLSFTGTDNTSYKISEVSVGADGKPNAYYTVNADNEKTDITDKLTAEQKNEINQNYVVVGSKAYQIDTIKKDNEGNVTGYFYTDEQGNKVSVPDTVKDEQKQAVSENYNLKYILFSFSEGNASGETNSGEDIKGGDYSKVTAENFSIAKDIRNDASLIRTSFNAEDKSDGTLWRNLNALKDDTSMFKQGDPKDFMVSIFSQLGINAEQAETFQNTQKAVTQNIINQRLSVSQVDTSEEFTYLIKYQQAYQAAAKMMNTIDGIYETTIFKLGNF